MKSDCMTSFAKVKTDIILRAANNYLEWNKDYRDYLRQEAVKKAMEPRKSWFGLVTKTRTAAEAEKHIELIEEENWDFDSPYHYKALWLMVGGCGLYFKGEKKIARDLIKLAKNSSEDAVYLSVDDNNFVNSWKDYSKEIRFGK